MKKLIYLLLFAIMAGSLPGNYAFGQMPYASAPVASPPTCVDGGTAITNNTCAPGTFSASFVGASLFTNNGNNGLSVGSVWRYSNVSIIGTDVINATITVDACYRAVLAEFDADAATDENDNQTLQAFFAPRIAPDQTLGTANRNGYIQFVIRFWKNGWTIPAILNGINYSHYDIDGVHGNQGYWFRETGMIKQVPAGGVIVSANSPTELTSYGCISGTDNWIGFAGTICNRNNFSRYAQVAANFKYPIMQSSVTIRMGYDYQDLPAAGTYGDGAGPRLYASKFECFNFVQETTLPVKLISFNGAYKNNAAHLNWTAENQVNFDHYEIERSNSNSNSFSSIGNKEALQNSSAAKEHYQYSDDLSAANGTVFFYRLKMVDKDGAFKYSNAIMIRKDQKTIAGISISPNPVMSGMATVRFEAGAKSMVEFKVIDMAGRVILKQQNNVTEGINSIAITNLNRLQPGLYIVQMNDGNNVNTAKFTISH
jgi:hypothetical protein